MDNLIIAILLTAAYNQAPDWMPMTAILGWGQDLVRYGRRA